MYVLHAFPSCESTRPGIDKKESWCINLHHHYHSLINLLTAGKLLGLQLVLWHQQCQYRGRPLRDPTPLFESPPLLLLLG